MSILALQKGPDILNTYVQLTPTNLMDELDNFTVASVTGASIDLQIAGPGGRSYAFIIDWHIRIVAAAIWGIAAFVLGLLGDFTQDWTSILAGAPAVLIYFLYHPVLEILMHGSTPGKKMAGVRIVDRQGGTPSAGALLIRNVFRLIDSMPAFYLIGLLTTFFTDQSVRFGDLAAGTVLVYDTKREKNAFDDVQQLTKSSVAPELGSLTSDVLARWAKLDEGSRLDLGRKILRSANITEKPKNSDDMKQALNKLID